MKNKINNYIVKSKIRYTTYIKKDIELYNLINQSIPLDIELKEKIFLILHDKNTPPVCKCGNTLKFISIIDGYTKYCSSTCPEKHNNRIECAKLFYSSQENKEKAKVNLKKTMLEKYGVDHNSKMISVKNKRLDTWGNKYDRSNPMQKHFNNLTYEILNNKELFTNFILFKTTAKEAYTELNIDGTTLYKYIHKYDLIEKIKFNNNSFFETDFINFIKTLGVNFVVNSKKIISPRQLDIFLPDLNIAFELNGLYWHSERKIKDKLYHYSKTKECLAHNIQLLHIWDLEWNTIEIRNIWMNKIKHMIKRPACSIGARLCNIKEIDKEYHNFLKKYHLAGPCPAWFKFGAFYNNTLIAVMTFGKMNNNKIEMSRWCVNGNYPGLFSKMLKFSQKALNFNYVYTYADYRYSIGDVYIKNGFVQEHEILPTYYYTLDFKQLWHRSNFMKNKIKKKYNIDVENHTEKELMYNLGYTRVYDAGKIRFSKTY